MQPRWRQLSKLYDDDKSVDFGSGLRDVTVGFAQEAADGNVATAIRALEHQWVEAQSRRDNGALNLIFDNALVYIEYGKLVSKGDYLSKVKAAKPGSSPITMEAMTVRSFGEAAIVIGTYRDNSAKSGKSPRWRFVDTWVRKTGGWMLVAAAAAPVSK